MSNLNAFSSFSIRLMPLTTPSHSLGPVVTMQKYWLFVWRDEVKATLGSGHKALISDINELSKNILCSTSAKEPNFRYHIWNICSGFPDKITSCLKTGKRKNISVSFSLNWGETEQTTQVSCIAENRKEKEVLLAVSFWMVESARQKSSVIFFSPRFTVALLLGARSSRLARRRLQRGSLQSGFVLQ